MVPAQLLIATRLLNRASHLQNIRVVVILGLVVPICSRVGRCSYQRSKQVLIALTFPDAEHRLCVYLLHLAIDTINVFLDHADFRLLRHSRCRVLLVCGKPGLLGSRMTILVISNAKPMTQI